MKKILSLVMMVLMAGGMAFGQAKQKANKDTENFKYDIECAGNASAGSYLVKVWSYSRRQVVAENQCRKNAVHGVIFKGFAGSTDCVGQKALAKNPGVELEHENYFKPFFEDGGEYQKYASIIGGTMEVVKLKGGTYKVGVVVSVQKDELRKALEAAGVIKGLNAGF